MIPRVSFMREEHLSYVLETASSAVGRHSRSAFPRSKPDTGSFVVVVLGDRSGLAPGGTLTLQ